jgi:uncharacterized protein with HEPN domain
MKDDLLYLDHIRECIRRIEEYATEGEQTFRDSCKLQDAILRNLQTLAESTKRLSADLKKADSEVDWQAIKGLRNILIHDYLGVDLDVIWNIVERDIPALHSQIGRMLRNAKVSKTKQAKVKKVNRSGKRRKTKD